MRLESANASGWSEARGQRAARAALERSQHQPAKRAHHSYLTGNPSPLRNEPVAPCRITNLSHTFSCRLARHVHCGRRSVQHLPTRATCFSSIPGTSFLFVSPSLWRVGMHYYPFRHLRLSDGCHDISFCSGQRFLLHRRMGHAWHCAGCIAIYFVTGRDFSREQIADNTCRRASSIHIRKLYCCKS